MDESLYRALGQALTKARDQCRAEDLIQALALVEKLVEAEALAQYQPLHLNKGLTRVLARAQAKTEELAESLWRSKQDRMVGLFMDFLISFAWGVVESLYEAREQRKTGAVLPHGKNLKYRPVNQKGGILHLK